MADYIWEWGIDWNAIQPTTGTSHLEEGLVRLTPTPEMTFANVKQGETLRIRIFNLTEGQPDTEIESIAIHPRAAEVGQTVTHPLSDLSSTVTAGGLQPSRVFGNSFHSWDSDVVTVRDTVLGSFLLTFKVKAHKLADDQCRDFVQDPEMIVGPNM